jgi:hypothetical protein
MMRKGTSTHNGPSVPTGVQAMNAFAYPGAGQCRQARCALSLVAESEGRHVALHTHQREATPPHISVRGPTRAVLGFDTLQEERRRTRHVTNTLNHQA